VPASSGKTRITPLSDLPLPPLHGRSEPLPLFFPGGPAPGAGHGVLFLTAFGGFGFGFGVEVAGLGVGAGVIRGVGAGVTRGVGRGVGAAVACDVGAGVTAGVGTGVTAGDVVDPGEAVAFAGVVGKGPDGDAEAPGSIDEEGVALGSGLALADGSTDGCPPGGDVGGCVPDGSVGSEVSAGFGVGVGTAAMSEGRREAAACCCSSAPPMPRAIVASTRFRTPRLRMSRTR
jgi:hypothetical protein